MHALNYCMLLPGPEAQQLAIYLGWLLHKTVGGITAGTLFILPGVITILGLSILYAQFQQLTWVQGLFYGLKPAVMAVVVQAVIRIGKRALKSRPLKWVAGVAFVGIFFLNIPFPWIVLSAGILGYFAGNTLLPYTSSTPNFHTDQLTTHTSPSWGRAIRIISICLCLWFAPVGLLVWRFGTESIFVTEAIFFSKMAMITFGGAYAVLAYIAQQAVDVYQWLGADEMLDGLGMAETTPGPLIMVVQFVGFMGAYRHPGELSPLSAGILGALITTWTTFVPCFLWIFLGAPYIEQLRSHKPLSSALTAITAAVVGVILNLAIWFSLHVLFATIQEFNLGPMRFLLPNWQTVDWAALVIATLAFVALLKWNWDMIKVLGVSAGIGLTYYLLT